MSNPEISSLSPDQILGSIPKGLRDPLVTEYNKILRNFRERRWEPAELNGGKLCEIVYTILAGYVAGSFATRPSKPRNMYDACKALEQADKKFPRSVRIQVPRMVVALYEVRNNRGVGHVGGDVNPNHQDAMVVLSMSQWIMAELVRIFHQVDFDAAARAVDGLVERTIPLIWRVNGTIRVLNPELQAIDKALVVLYAGEPMTAAQLAEAIEYKNLSRFRNEVLAQAHAEKLLNFDPSTDRVDLSPIGSRIVEETINLEVA